MAKTLTSLQVMVAYPDDVAEERDVLGDVIDELNLTWSHTLGLQLELVDWKTHSWPNFGSDAQAIINEEIGDDYDIFIGIMWTRFGEPTPRAQSGTAEEFDRALRRFKDWPDQLRIMFYFKSAGPTSLSDLDPEQLTLIRELKTRVDAEGGLYSEFANTNQFKSQVRMHLSKQVQEWGKTWGPSSTSPLVTNRISSNELPSEATVRTDILEEGFLDLLERSQEGFEDVAEILGKMTVDMQNSTVIMQQRTQEMSDLAKSNADLKQRKKAINDTATDMDQYSSLLEQDVPRYSKALTTALDSLSRAMSIWSEDQMEGADEARLAFNEIRKIKDSLGEYLKSVVATRANVSAFPRVTSVFNRAKRRMISVFDSLIAEIQRGHDLLDDLDDQFGRILGD
jgi:hypothetical protein